MNCFNLKGIISGAMAVFLLPLSAQATSLDHIYGPILRNNDILAEVSIGHFEMTEEGDHGSSSFGSFSAHPDYQTLGSHIRFNPLQGLEIGLGYKGELTSKYQRLTMNQADTSVTFYNQYDLDYFHHYFGSLRYQFSPSQEIFIKGYNNFQRSNWQSAPGLVAFDFMTDIDSHYEDIELGYRFVSGNKADKERSSLEHLTSALLDDGQWSVQAFAEYKSAKMERQNRYTATSPDTLREYKNDLSPHVVPQVDVAFGLTDRITVETGLRYAPTIRYAYDFKQYNFNNTSNFIQANYSIRDHITVPLAVTYQPDENWRIHFGVDTTYANQSLEYHEKETDNSFTQYAGKELDYLNVNPTLEIAYFIDKEKPLAEGVLEQYQKPMLSKGQALLKFTFEKDITTLDKNSANGAQNFIEYDSLFLYPVDSFVSGTEYSAFLIGNTSSLSTNVALQNYHTLEAALDYGVTDKVNTSVGIGYHSGSGLHHFSVNDLASRFIKVEPYLYYDVGGNIKMFQNGRLAVDVHYVPSYKTFVTTDINPEEFEGDVDYVRAVVSYTHLF